jgi:hypothetical protein
MGYTPHSFLNVIASVRCHPWSTNYHDLFAIWSEFSNSMIPIVHGAYLVIRANGDSVSARSENLFSQGPHKCPVALKYKHSRLIASYKLDAILRVNGDPDHLPVLISGRQLFPVRHHFILKMAHYKGFSPSC